MTIFTKELAFNAIADLVTNIIQEYQQEPKKALRLMEKWSQPAVQLSSIQGYSESWHLQETAAILTKLETSQESGLSIEKVPENLQKYGANVLAESQPCS